MPHSGHVAASPEGKSCLQKGHARSSAAKGVEHIPLARACNSFGCPSGLRPPAGAAASGLRPPAGAAASGLRPPAGAAAIFIRGSVCHSARAVIATPLELALRLGLEGPPAHFEEALTHPSYANEHKGSARDNQRLEFLGDAVLGLCVSELLMDRFPEAREGELSLMRASLVNTDALAAWAREATLGEALRLGRGADAAGERTQKNVLADAVEAIVGAVYLDLGLEATRRVSRAIVSEPLERLANGPRLGRDPKSELQERVQARGGASPKYRVVETIGPDHNREFVVAVDVDGELLGEGRGRSKKQAEQEAARAAMRSPHPLAVAVARDLSPDTARSGGHDSARPAPPDSVRSSSSDSARSPSSDSARSPSSDSVRPASPDSGGSAPQSDATRARFESQRPTKTGVGERFEDE